MKNILYPASFIIFIILVLGSLSWNPFPDPSHDLNSEHWYSDMTTDTVRPVNFPYPTQWNFNYRDNSTLNGGTVGALLLQGKYYLNFWASGFCYLLPNTGVNGAPSTNGMIGLGSVGGLRDLTTDGQYVYGGNATSVLYKFTPMLTVVTQFNLTGIIRGITWDPNRKALWYCDFSGSIQCRDTSNVQRWPSISNTYTAKYGLGFDSLSTADSAFLFVWIQDFASVNRLVRYYISPAAAVLVNDWVFTSAGGSAGGAEIVIDNYTSPPRSMLILNYQNYAIVGYKLSSVILALEETNETIRDFVLNQNFPNPFNPVTKIGFTLSRASMVSLEVFNSLGEKISTIFDGHISAGEHEYLFDASALSSGVYFYKLQTEKFTQTKKMILAK